MSDRANTPLEPSLSHSYRNGSYRPSSSKDKPLVPSGTLFSPEEWQQICAYLGFTERQAAVLRGVLLGAKDDRIANNLGITCPTVRSHLQRMFKQFEVGDRVGLVVAVFKIFRGHLCKNKQ